MCFKKKSKDPVFDKQVKIVKSILGRKAFNQTNEEMQKEAINQFKDPLIPISSGLRTLGYHPNLDLKEKAQNIRTLLQA